MRFAIAQINPVVGDLTGNRFIMKRYIALAKEQGADVVAFPEMVLCGYPPEDLLYKKQFVRDVQGSLRVLARESKGIIVILGFVDSPLEGGVFNAAGVLADGSVKGVYHKQNLPNYGVFDERRYFQEGRGNPLLVVDQRVIGVNICEDIWVNGGVCQNQVKRGARVLLNISASPYHVGKLTRRENLLKERARQLETHIIYVNMVGGQDELVFDGGSMVVDPRGKVLVHAKQFEEDLVCVDLDLPRQSGRRSIVGDIHLTMPNQGGTKPDMVPVIAKRYPRVERIYRALVLGTKDYVIKNRFQKVVIGLSGGIDSSLVAAVAVDALGAENVIGVTMPSRFTSKETRGDAWLLAENLGIECLEIPIERVFEEYLTELKTVFHGREPDVAEENIQARIRGNFLMALSNKFGWLVLTTGNKSEIAVGYCTLYGDMSGGFAVIKDLPKTKVYALSDFVNSRGSIVIPPSVIQRPPSAELRSDQKDQDSLPPYEILDAILELYIEKNQPVAYIARKFDSDVVKSVIRLVDRNEYKRRQAPPGIKITDRAFGKDWRLPLTNGYRV
jgi:NAD+ synthase (glutamine-hydrolysing)